MTNRRILKLYIESLLGKLKNSRDLTDKAVYDYLLKKRKGSLHTALSRNIHAMGESPTLNWTHNIRPEKIRRIIREANSNKHKPGYARSAVLRYVGVW